MRKLLTAVMLLVSITAFSKEKVKPIAVVAHRGYWQCEDGGMSRNSLASLASAQKQGFYGSECDVHISSDGTVFVWHDSKIGKRRVQEMTMDELGRIILPNGENIPTLDQYLKAYKSNAKKYRSKTRLVIEVKKHRNAGHEDMCVDKTIELLKKNHLYNPKKIVFISFSLKACKKLKSENPKFMVQYLEKDLTPAKVQEQGIPAMDTNFQVLRDHPTWTSDAHKLGMKMNCWTASTKEDILDMIGFGVDYITSDTPDLVRELLAEKQIKEAK